MVLRRLRLADEPKVKSQQPLKGPAMKRAITKTSLAICAGILMGTAITVSSGPACAASVDKKTVVFVCLHGSVKSQIAAAHFNRIAGERGLPYTAISRGIEPDKEIPASIRAGLARDGLAPASETPSSLTADEASSATEVFAFDEVPSDRKGTASVTRWSDVPPAMKDYDQARDAIARHVEDVVVRLAPETKTAPPGVATQR
jgi:protein-tyrosine-phosphatase